MSEVNALSATAGTPPARQSGKVGRSRNDKLRGGREYLTADEIKKLLKAARRGRHGARDHILILIGFRHGLRASELVALRWSAVDLAGGNLHVTRVKNGTPSIQPLDGDELRALRQLRRVRPDSPFVFVSERGAPMTTSNLRKLIARLGIAAKLGFPVHPHQLRHACGHALANRGVDTRSLMAYLGHRSIDSTVAYTAMAPERFRNFWR